MQLSTCRAVGLAVGSIPWTACADWCRLNGIRGAAAQHLINVVMIVDGDYLTKINAPKSKEGNP